MASTLTIWCFRSSVCQQQGEVGFYRLKQGAPAILKRWGQYAEFSSDSDLVHFKSSSFLLSQPPTLIPPLNMQVLWLGGCFSPGMWGMCWVGSLGSGVPQYLVCLWAWSSLSSPSTPARETSVFSQPLKPHWTEFHIVQCRAKTPLLWRHKKY